MAIRLNPIRSFAKNSSSSPSPHPHPHSIIAAPRSFSLAEGSRRRPPTSAAHSPRGFSFPRSFCSPTPSCPPRTVISSQSAISRPVNRLITRTRLQFQRLLGRRVVDRFFLTRPFLPSTHYYFLVRSLNRLLPRSPYPSPDDAIYRHWLSSSPSALRFVSMAGRKGVHLVHQLRCCVHRRRFAAIRNSTNRICPRRQPNPIIMYEGCAMSRNNELNKIININQIFLTQREEPINFRKNLIK